MLVLYIIKVSVNFYSLLLRSLLVLCLDLTFLALNVPTLTSSFPLNELKQDK